MPTLSSIIIAQHATHALQAQTAESIELEKGIRSLMEKGAALHVESLT